MGNYDDIGITRSDQEEYERKLAARAKKGTRKVKIIGIIMLIALTVSLVSNIFLNGFSVLKLLGFLIDIVILKAFVSGKCWARILYMIAVILLLPSIVMNLISVFAILAHIQSQPLISLLLAVIYIPSEVLNIVMIVILFADRDVDEFFKSEKRKSNLIQRNDI